MQNCTEKRDYKYGRCENSVLENSIGRISKEIEKFDFLRNN